MTGRISLGGIAAILRRGRAAAAGAAALSLTLILGLPATAAGPTYTFAGLKWGSTPEQVSRQLIQQGFKVSTPKNGPVTEFVEMNAWLDIRRIDRGKRLFATGSFLGAKVEVDLVFGFNDRLERVHLRVPTWDGTRKGAKQMVATGDRLVAHYENDFGRPFEKRTPYGFVDTARWSPAADGSHVEMYIRGSEGFMFYPNHTTSLNVNFWNNAYRSDLPTIATGSGGNPSYLVGDQPSASPTDGRSLR